ncbi:MAG: zinc finger domain-containing protein [Dialister invisus]
MEKEVLMADTSVSFKCPNCSAPLAYAPGADHVTCEYCGTELSIADLEAFYAAKEENAAKAEHGRKSGILTVRERNGAKTRRRFSAPLPFFCGAEIVCDENTIATECCYCGNPTMIAQRYDGALRPDYVIPFQKTKRMPRKPLKISTRELLLPSNFVSQNRVDAIQGMYVPFWLFDSKVTAVASYKAKNVNTFVVGKNQITEERVYRCDREGEMKFNRVPMDGSKKMDDTWMESIGPFDYSTMVPFTTAYLAGYLADKYDVPAEEMAPRADELVTNTALAQMDDTVTGYTSCNREDGFVSKDENTVSYALAPVWILSTTYNGTPYTFIMNAQSGKFVGSLPVDKNKASMYTAAFVVFVPILYFLIKMMFGSL